MSESKNKDVLGKITKILGLIAIFSGIYGVSYQKGMIIGMGVGNINGNYDIREIFNSAVFGYIDLFGKAIKLNIFDIALANWKMIIPFAIAGVAVPFIYNFRDKIVTFSEGAKEKIKDTPKLLAGSYFLAPLIGAAIGTLVNIVGAILSVAFFFFLSVLLLPALIGYVSGEAKIRSIKGDPVCAKVSEEVLKNDFVRQCTQITMRGQKIMGEVLLENSEGYFMHLNKAFLYISKNQELCIYSKYEESQIVKKEMEFQFKASQIDSICGKHKNSNDN